MGSWAVVTAVAYRMGGPIADVAGWCYSGIGLIALLPALLGLNGSGLWRWIRQWAAVLADGGIRTHVVGGHRQDLAFRWRVSDFRYLPLSWSGSSRPSSSGAGLNRGPRLGDYQVSMFVAIGAAIVWGCS